MEFLKKTDSPDYAAPTAEIVELSSDIVLLSGAEDNESGYGPPVTMDTGDSMIPKTPNRW